MFPLFLSLILGQRLGFEIRKDSEQYDTLLLFSKLQCKSEVQVHCKTTHARSKLCLAKSMVGTQK